MGCSQQTLDTVRLPAGSCSSPGGPCPRSRLGIQCWSWSCLGAVTREGSLFGFGFLKAGGGGGRGREVGRSMGVQWNEGLTGKAAAGCPQDFCVRAWCISAF